MESLGFRLLAARTPEEAACATLDCALEVTSSPSGGVFLVQPGGDVGLPLALAGGFGGKDGAVPGWPGDGPGVCRRAVESLRPVRANGSATESGGAASEPRTSARFLAVPAIHDRLLLGLVAVSGSSRDYGDDHEQALVDLASAFAISLQRLAQEKELQDAARGAPREKDQGRLESVLREASTEWRATFDALESLILIVDDLGTVQRLNRAAANAAGRDFRECLGRKIDELGSGQPWRTMATIAAENPGEAVSVQVRDDKTGQSWEVTGVRMHRGPGTTSRIILSARDNTVLVELESSVRKWEKMAAIGELTAGVAHEVRNPLFAISAGVDALGTILKDEGKVANLLRLMRREVTRLTRLMEDLLAYGKPGTPEHLAEEPVFSAVDLGVRSCESRAQSAGVSIALRGGDRPWLVRMDRVRLSQVVANLVDNAIQHSANGGTVVVEIEGFERDKRRWVRCSTRDSGPGFQEADIPRLFEPFFSRRAGGTGLGLPIALRIIDQHGGAISARNRPEGGAEVAFELPCVRARARTAANLSS